MEFVLDKHEFSMPVGRITYMHLGPLTFEEFLEACGKKQLIDYLQQFSWNQTIPLVLHEQLMSLFKEFLIIVLSSLEPYYISPALYYWVREKKNANAEIDYLLQQGTTILPVEVKSGSTGSLKSLHLFMELKKLPHALRINAGLPSEVLIQTKGLPESSQYRLYSIPFYLTEQIHRLLGQIVKRAKTVALNG